MGGAIIGRGGNRIGKFVDECEEVGGEIIGGFEADESEDGGGDNAKVGGERAWNVPGVMVLFSDLGREVAKAEGANGEALISGMKERGRAVSGLGSGTSGLGG
jgi:hypothetical protein